MKNTVDNILVEYNLMKKTVSETQEEGALQTVAYELKIAEDTDAEVIMRRVSVVGSLGLTAAHISTRSGSFALSQETHMVQKMPSDGMPITVAPMRRHSVLGM